MDLYFYLILLAGSLGAAESGSSYDYQQPYEPPSYSEEAPDMGDSGDAPDIAMEEPQPDMPGDVTPGDDASGQDMAAEETPDEGDAQDEVAELPAIPEEPAQPAEPAGSDDPAARGLVAETDPPSGKMTTALEVRPILTVTKPQWIAVRDYDGQDLLYFTNLLAWRCGLLEIRYSVDGAPLETLPMEPCYLDEATPNAIKSDGVEPYVALPPESVQSVHVELVYDDLGTDSADYTRPDILMK